MDHPWDKKRPLSACLPGGLSRRNKGKVSRTLRPVLDNENCNKCNFCWIYCPDGCINRGDVYSINYAYCKGCGVCATECPKKAISMKREDKV